MEMIHKFPLVTHLLLAHKHILSGSTDGTPRPWVLALPGGGRGASNRQTAIPARRAAEPSGKCGYGTRGTLGNVVPRGHFRRRVVSV